MTLAAREDEISIAALLNISSENGLHILLRIIAYLLELINGNDTFFIGLLVLQPLPPYSRHSLSYWWFFLLPFLYRRNIRAWYNHYDKRILHIAHHFRMLLLTAKINIYFELCKLHNANCIIHVDFSYYRGKVSFKSYNFPSKHITIFHTPTSFESGDKNKGNWETEIPYFLLSMKNKTYSCTTIKLQLYNYTCYGCTTPELWSYNDRG